MDESISKGSMFSVLRSAQQAINTVATTSTPRALQRDQATWWWPPGNRRTVSLWCLPFMTYLTVDKALSALTCIQSSLNQGFWGPLRHMLKSFDMHRHNFASHAQTGQHSRQQAVRASFLQPKDYMCATHTHTHTHTPAATTWLVLTMLALIHELSARSRPVVTSPVGRNALVPACAYWPCAWPPWPSLIWIS